MSPLPTEPRVRGQVVAAVAAIVFVVVALIHLTALLVGWSAASDVTMGLLVPPLAVHLGTVLTLPHRREENAVILGLLMALFFCWLGDLADAVLLKLAMFGLGHLWYCFAWWPWRRFSLVARRRTRLLALGAYALVATTMVVVLAGHAGWMSGPIAIYAVAVSAMAVLASGAGPRAAMGGAVFVLSDSLLAWNLFVSALPLGDLVVMTSYLAAQWMVVSGSRKWLLAPSRGV